jgi:hypothetical protein
MNTIDNHTPNSKLTLNSKATSLIVDNNKKKKKKKCVQQFAHEFNGEL